MNKKSIYVFLCLALLALVYMLPAYAENANYALGAQSVLENVRGTKISAYNKKYSYMALDGDSTTYAMGADKLWVLKIDLGEVKKSIGSVGVTFADKTKTPKSYQILVSADNVNWDIVAEATDNIMPERRFHKFLASDVRYVKIKNVGNSSDNSFMGIAEVEIYRVGEKELNATLVYPSSMRNAFSQEQALSVKFGKEVNSKYFDLIQMTDESGNEIEAEKTVGEDGMSIELMPSQTLNTGEVYNVQIKKFNKWSFGVNGEIPRGFSGKIYKPISMLPFGNILNSTDGDETTYDYISDSLDRGRVFEYDLNKVYKNIREFNIVFNTAPQLFEIYTSEDGKSWSKATKNYTLGSKNISVVIDAVTARYIRLCGVEGLMTVAEFGVYAAPGTIPPQEEISKETDDGTELSILTVSDSEYFENPQYAIYPAFVDNMPYEVWSETGKTSYFQVCAEGGKKPYTFEITNGALPQGLVMDSEGKITGTATLEETAQFTVKVSDANENTAEKSLTMTANPYRSKWFKDAKFGVMTQWGVFSMSDMGYSMTNTVTDIQNFEALMDGKFNAEEWAQQLEDMGAKVFNFTVMAGDSIRMFPSTSDSAKNAKLTTNIAGELIEACHRHGIKFIGYIAPEFSWVNSLHDYDPTTKSTSLLVVNTVKELMEMGMDGVWIDAGWASGFVDWDLMLKTVRTINPYATVQSNPSVTKTGWIPMYPEVDIQTFECTNIDQTDYALHEGFRSGVKKKMAVEQTGLVGGSWGPSERTGNLKSTQAIIDNIQKNWDNGVTYMLVTNTSVDGELINNLHKQSVAEITTWVKENINSCKAPISDIDTSVSYSTAQTMHLSSENGTEIYYTTDGSIPDKSSSRYNGSISVSETTVIKAAAYINGKQKSAVREFDVIIDKYIGESNIFGKVNSANVVNTEANMMSGMFFTVKNNPVVIDKIGKIVNSNTELSGFTVIYELGEIPRPIYAADTNFTAENKNGFSYADITPVKLNANSNYYILTEVKDSYIGASEQELQSTENSYIRVNKGLFTDISMTKYYFADSNNQYTGQAIDLIYDVMNNKASNGNLALNAKTKLLSNSDDEIEPSFDYYYGFYAVDGNKNTFAAANRYAWTLWIDLGSVKSISKIKLSFKDNLYSTEFGVGFSNDNVNWTRAAYLQDNSKKELTFTKNFSYLYDGKLQVTSARYIIVRSYAPAEEGQPGGQMFLSEVEVY